MFVIKDLLYSFLIAVAALLGWVLDFLTLVIVVRVILSWVSPDPYNPIVRLIGSISEPLLKPFRRLIPSWKLNGLDLSPFFAIATLLFLKIFLVKVLNDLALYLR